MIEELAAFLRTCWEKDRDEAAGWSPFRFDQATAHLALLDDLLAQPHTDVEDGFYSCPAAPGATGPRRGEPCDCGRDDRLKHRLRLLARPYQERTGYRQEWSMNDPQDLHAIRVALERLPATCTYHGTATDPHDRGLFLREACCDSGVPARRRKLAEEALDRLTTAHRATEPVWVVAQVHRFDDQGQAADWDLGGVFTTDSKARAVCTEPGDAMWPVTLDQFLGRDTATPPGLTYPAVPSEE